MSVQYSVHQDYTRIFPDSDADPSISDTSATRTDCSHDSQNTQDTATSGQGCFSGPGGFGRGKGAAYLARLAAEQPGPPAATSNSETPHLKVAACYTYFIAAANC